jgi:hypothetical protein
MFTEDTVLENSSASQEAEHLQGRTAKPLTLLNEMTPEVQQKIDLIDAIVQAPDRKSRRSATTGTTSRANGTPASRNQSIESPVLGDEGAGEG